MAGKKRTKALALLVILVVTVAMVIVARVQSKNGGGKPKMRGGSAVQTVFSVKTMTAEKTVLHDYVATNGEVEAQSSIEVFPDMGGKIRSVNVSLGSPVKKGAVIARVDPSEPGTQYALSPVYAPISGSIVSTPLKEGTTVSTNSAITIIGDVDRLQITANIPERYVALLKTGLSADISLEAYPGVVFKATISRVSPVVDATSRTKEIIMTFDKKDSRINAGMFAKVILYTRDFTGEVVMPSDSVVTKDSKQYAFVVNSNGIAEQREVVLGESVDGMIQVLSGIKEGEKIVVAGQTSLSDGAQVRDITDGVPQNAVVSQKTREAEHIAETSKQKSEEKGELEQPPKNPVADITPPAEEKIAETSEKKQDIPAAASSRKRSWGGVSSTGER